MNGLVDFLSEVFYPEKPDLTEAASTRQRLKTASYNLECASKKVIKDLQMKNGVLKDAE